MSSEFLVACAICFGGADGPLLDAARLGVLVMVGVTVVILSLFARFFLRISKSGGSPSYLAGSDSPSRHWPGPRSSIASRCSCTD